MARFKRATLVLVALVVCLFATLSAGVASAQEPTPTPTPTPSQQAGKAGPKAGQHCATVIQRVSPDSPETRIVSRKCVTGTPQEAKAALAVPAASVILVRFYQHSGFNIDPNTGQYNGGFEDEIYGADGPCDHLGYGMSNLTVMNDLGVGGISSYRTYNSCDGQALFKTTNYGTTCAARFGPTYAVDYVGYDCNDRVYSMKVYRWAV